jgi:hypothetical protein
MVSVWFWGLFHFGAAGTGFLVRSVKNTLKKFSLLERLNSLAGRTVLASCFQFIAVRSSVFSSDLKERLQSGTG